MKSIMDIIAGHRILLGRIAVFVLVLICGVTYCAAGNVYRTDKDMPESDKSQHEETDESGWQQAMIDKESGAKTESGANIYVYMCGCVVNPGVYVCADGTRLYQLVELAGGFTADADENSINLVLVAEDGQRVYIPAVGEVVADSAGGVASDGSVKIKVNINTADKSELMTLPGIGESRAADIVAYRQKNGYFANTKDIMKVSGIKEAAYEKIKDYIKV